MLMRSIERGRSFMVTEFAALLLPADLHMYVLWRAPSVPPTDIIIINT